MSNLSNLLNVDINPLGGIIKMIDIPSDGSYLPTGTVISRTAYPELDDMFPYPKLTQPNVDIWIQRPTSLQYVNWMDICYGNDKFVAVSYDGIAAYSDDGITWTSFGLGIDYCTSVCYGNGKFVAVGLFNKCAITSDGTDFALFTLPSNSWKSICYGNGKFVIVSSNNIISYLYNGIDWVTATLPVGVGYWSSICYGNDKFVAVDSNNNYVLYSYDGINWSQATLPISGYWKSICYGNGMFVAISSNGKAITSINGIDWIQRTYSTSTFDVFKKVCYGNGVFIILAENTPYSVTSTDGITWRKILLSPICGSMCYANGMFVSLTRNTILFTTITMTSSLTDLNLAKLGNTTTSEYMRVK